MKRCVACHTSFCYTKRMAIIHLLSLLIFICLLSGIFQKSLTEMIPVAVSVLVLLLYGLSFGNLLWIIDILAPVFLLGMLLYLVTGSSEKRREIRSFVRRELHAPAFLTAVFGMTVVAVCVSSKLTSWWDDYNFWSTDVKSLFYLNGFAGKYENVAAEFGDYPPATQMMKWWFLHFSPKELKEGLLFSGYYVFNLAYLVPLLQRIKKKNAVTMLLGMVLLWLFPSTVEAFWCDGCCADFSMAVVYGAFLTSVLDREAVSPWLYYGRQCLYLMVLILCKNTGFIWAAFGMVFMLVYALGVCKKEGFGWREAVRRRGQWAVVILPMLTEGSWLLFCLKNRRVAKLTGTAVHMATGSMNIPDYQEQMGKSFAEAFVKWPLHRYTTGAVDLSPLALLILVLLAFVFLGLRKKISAGESRFFFGYSLITAVVFYSLNLVSHLTIFAVEAQYLEPFGMVSSIERYGAPFTIGTLYLLAYLCLEKEEGYWGFIGCAVMVLLTTDYTSAYRAVWGYRSTLPEVREEREQIVDGMAQDFLQKIGAGSPGSAGRVLYLRDSSDISWVRNTYISFEASPVSVMYGNINGTSTGYEELKRLMEDSHAGYLYVEQLNEDNTELFKPMIQEEPFEYRTLYRIEMQNHEIRLVACREQ